MTALGGRTGVGSSRTGPVASPGPRFLGIGSTRCGTTALHAALREHPALWLPPVKELHYFDRTPRGGRRFDARWRRHARRWPRAWRAARAGDPRARADRRFFRRYLFGRRDLEGYRSWFRHPEWTTTGEITPAYCTLPDAVVAEVASALPEVRIVFMMRDPIERAWSAAAKSLARGRPVEDVPVEEWRRKFAGAGFIARSDYVGILARWERHVPRERIFVGFLEDLEDDAEGFLARLAGFLGVPPAPSGRRLAAGRVNASGRGAVPPQVERALAPGFLEMNRVLHERFGSHATRWYERTRRVCGAG